VKTNKTDARTPAICEAMSRPSIAVVRSERRAQDLQRASRALEPYPRGADRPGESDARLLYDTLCPSRISPCGVRSEWLGMRARPDATLPACWPACTVTAPVDERVRELDREIAASSSATAMPRAARERRLAVC